MSTIEKMLDAVLWEDVAEPAMTDDTDIPYVTHVGYLDIGQPLKCYQLSDGMRVIDAEDMERLFGGGYDRQD